MESQTGEWRTIRDDAIATVMTELVVEADFRNKRQPGWFPGMPPERKGDILVFDYPSAGRTLVLYVTLSRALGPTPPHAA
jgi:hypothetical protein